jgi:Ser/Thr protein kinase RdoA (MazF antagonist)
MNYNIKEPETIDTPDEEQTAFQQLVPDEMLDAIESQGYLCDGRFIALNSYENRVYQIGLEDAEPIVAKFYRPARWADEAIIEEHQFTLELAAEEIPVIPPLVNAEGKTLHQHGLFRFALYERRGGHTPELDNPDQLEIIGRFLARIHLLGEQSKFAHRASIGIDNLGRESAAFLLEHKHIPMELETAYSTLIETLLEKIEQRFEQTGTYKTIRLHGDCHPNNILWRDETPHIVDFDDARTGPAVQDLWMFLSGDREYMNKRLGDLLIGYEQFFEFDPRELQLIEALRTLRIIHYAAWLASRWSDPAFPYAFPWFNTTNYWEEHVLSLREQASALNEPSLIW